MIDVNATMITVWVMCAIVIFGAGFGLRGWLMASKDGEDEKDGLEDGVYSQAELMACTRNCARRRTPGITITNMLCEIGYKEHCIRNENTPTKKPTELAYKHDGFSDTIQDTFTAPHKEDTPSLCSRCIRAEGCVAAVKGDQMYECETFKGE